MFKKITHFVMVAAALLVALQASIAQPAKAITYGDPVVDAPAGYSEVVSLWSTDYFDGVVHKCTATLIEQQIAITAAHCIQGDSSQKYVEVGAATLGAGRKIPVLSSWYNPRYSSTRIANDVAVVYLSEPANIPGLAVLKRLKTFTTRTKLEISGWGVDQNGDELTYLHRLSVKYDISRAKRWYGNSFNRRTTVAAGRFFAAEKVYGGACNGDSGGPLFSGRTGGARNLVGIVSYGIRGCDVNAPTVFARVDYYWSRLQQGIQFVKADAARIAQEIVANPITASIVITKPYSSLPYWDATVQASTYSKASISKWCFFLDGRPVTQSEYDYGSGELPFSASSDGCLLSGAYDLLTSGVAQFDFGALPSGAHSLSAVVTDSLGRTFTVPAATFVR